MDAPPVRWGILGTGLIAGAFAYAVRTGTRGHLAVVGSRGTSELTPSRPSTRWPERSGAMKSS